MGREPVEGVLSVATNCFAKLGGAAVGLGLVLTGCSSEVGPVVVQLLPEDPYHFDSLRVEIIQPAMGPNGKPLGNEADYEYTWFRDGQKMGSYNNLSQIAAPAYDDVRDEVN